LVLFAAENREGREGKGREGREKGREDTYYRT
jgi:hypothetical protein